MNVNVYGETARTCKLGILNFIDKKWHQLIDDELSVYTLTSKEMNEIPMVLISKWIKKNMKKRDLKKNIIELPFENDWMYLTLPRKVSFFNGTVIRQSITFQRFIGIWDSFLGPFDRCFTICTIIWQNLKHE